MNLYESIKDNLDIAEWTITCNDLDGNLLCSGYTEFEDDAIELTKEFLDKYNACEINVLDPNKSTYIKVLKRDENNINFIGNKKVMDKLIGGN